MIDAGEVPRIDPTGRNVASSAADLFAADDRPVIRYPVEQWGGLVVCLRAPSMATVLAISELEASKERSAELRQVSALFEAGLVNPGGDQMLDADGVNRLFAEKSATAMTELAKKLRAISGLSEDEATSEGN